MEKENGCSLNCPDCEKGKKELIPEIIANPGMLMVLQQMVFAILSWATIKWMDWVWVRFSKKHKPKPKHKHKKR